jgi:threonyl-tRNA synthetase
MERFCGVLIEHFAGKFPVWLSPEQVRIIPITDGHNEAALKIESELKSAGIRARADLDSDRMNGKIRKAQGMQVPYMVILGDQEIAQETVSLRKRDGTRADGMPFREFKEMVLEKIRMKDINL